MRGEGERQERVESKRGGSKGEDKKEEEEREGILYTLDKLIALNTEVLVIANWLLLKNYTLLTILRPLKCLSLCGGSLIVMHSWR